MEKNVFDAANDLIGAIAQRIRNLKRMNIIVAGKTGVGKSTLINAMFKENMADTGLGRPVTEHMRAIEKKEVPLCIYDTRGFEMDHEQQKKAKDEIIDVIKKKAYSNDVNERIHCIWYCINTASNRIDPEEIKWLRELTEDNKVTRVPIIIVLTQSISKKNAEELQSILENENLDIVQIIPVLAMDFEVDENYTRKAYGLDRLVKVMEEALPDELLDTFHYVQIACLEEKKKRARAAVAAGAATATAEGAVPIPFSDCAVLIPTQLAMIASITVIFGFDVNTSVIVALLSSTLGAGGATLLGKAIVTNLIKLIPGAGSVIGGAISASTAGVITAALGEAYIAVLELVFNGEMKIEDIGTKKGKEVMSTVFKKQLSMTK